MPTLGSEVWTTCPVIRRCMDVITVKCMLTTYKCMCGIVLRVELEMNKCVDNVIVN